MNKEIEIPEGYKARIEGNKVIIELAESYGEIMIKHIIDIIKDNAKSKSLPCDAEIAYLENQKELFKSGSGLYYYDGKETIYCGYTTTEERQGARTIGNVAKEITKDRSSAIAFLKNAEIMDENGELAEKYRTEDKEQSTEWSEDYREEDLRTRFAFYTYKDEDDVLYLSNVFVEETSRNKGFGTKILAAAEKVAETLGAINIRLKVKQNSPANAWYRKNGYGYLTFEGDYDWLEKTLEYLKPSKKEWSEEDKRNFYWISTTIQERHLTPEYTQQVHKILSWLKSLRPQPHGSQAKSR